MTLQVLVSLIAFAFLIDLGDAQDCTAIVAAGNCDFYSQCVETRIPCGTSGYALGYGERYCNIFADELNCFTTEGQVWVNAVEMCLMQKLLNSAVYNNNGNCQELLEFGFNSHPDCYYENGFCTDILQSLSNWQCLAEVYAFSDLTAKNGIQQIYETGKRCNQQSVDTFLSSVDYWIQSVTGRVEDLLKTMRDLLGGCKTGLDLIFVMDSSGSIGSANFYTMQNFVVNVIENFEIRANSTRVGVIRYASSAYIIIPLGSINNAEQLSTAIYSITYSSGGTSTNLALDLVPIAFANARINQGIPHIVILLTDGNSYSPTLTAQAAVKVHDDNIEVYSVGIGDGINEAELLTIASDPNYVYRVTDFSSESFAEKLRPLQLTACTTPAVFDINQQLKSTISKGQSQNLEYKFSSEGFTIHIGISVGELVVYGSFTIRNPTLLTADFQVDGTETLEYFVSPALYDSSVFESANRSLNNTSVFVSLVGQQDNNTFIMNTTFGDTTSNGVIVSTSILKVFLMATIFMKLLIVY